MRPVRDRIETWFEKTGRFICRHPFWVALVFFGFAALLIAQLPKTTIDTSPTGMLHPDSPAMVDYNAFRDQFGRDEIILAAVGPVDVFSEKILKKIIALHDDLEENVPHLDDIVSMKNARSTRGEGDTLIVEDLLEELPQTRQDMDGLKNRVMSNPLYKNTLINQKGTYTTIAVKTSAYSDAGAQDGLDIFDEFNSSAEYEPKIEYISDKENSEAVQAVREIVARHSNENFPVHVAGSPVMTEDLHYWMLKDMRKFSALALGLIGLLLFAVFRTVAGVVWPLLTVVLSLLCTLGLMAATGVPLKMPTQILPSFILAVGVGDSVHILAIFYRAMSLGKSRHEAIAFALGHSGLAVVLTSITTAGGLLSFARADIAPISDLGLFAAAGVLMALAFSLFWLPAMLAIFPAKPRVRKQGALNISRLDGFLAGIGDFATKHPKKILAVTAVVLFLSALGISRLHFSHHALSWFPADSDIRVSTKIIDKNMKGTLTMEVVLDTGMENGFYDPEKLHALAGLADKIKAFSTDAVYVGHTQSLAHVLKEIHQALNENQREFYHVPDDRALIAQEFLLFQNSGSDDLEDIVSSDFSKARLTIKVPSVDAVYYVEFTSKVKKMIAKAFPDNTKITLTGLLTVLFSTFCAVMHTMAESYIIAMAVITLLMVLMIGSLRLGLISMIPNLSPIILCMGIMGALDLTLNAFTILIGSVALGLAVDDTIHLMHNFRRYFAIYGDAEKAVHETLQTTGRALLFTTVALSSGFLVFLFASMKNLATYGALTALAIVFALIADFLVAPALLTLMYGSRGKTARTG